MHSHHKGADCGIFPVAIEHCFDPFHLRAIELVLGGIIQVDEINPVAYPVVVGPRLSCLLIILQALFPYVRTIEISMKFLNKLSPRFWWCRLMVADAQVKGQVAPNLDLVVNEIIPSLPLVL